MKKLMILMILFFILNGCSSKYVPTVVTEYLPETKQEIPSELLEVYPAPNADVLKHVKVCKGEKALKNYGMELLYSDYMNRQKLLAIKELLK